MTDSLDVGPEDQEPVRIFVSIRRFERAFRRFLLEKLAEEYPGLVEERVRQVLGPEYDVIRERGLRQHLRYGRQPPSDSDLKDLFENFGFEHYLRLVENAAIWERCFSNFLISRDDVRASLGRIKDARNEIMHTRSSVHPQLWPSCLLEIDTLLGQITLGRRVLEDLVALVRT